MIQNQMIRLQNLSGCPTPCFKKTKQERPQGLALILQTEQKEIWYSAISLQNIICQRAQ
jgi:hypothetical protein